MKIRSILAPSLVLTAVLLVTTVASGQSQSGGPAYSESAITKAVLETNTKMSEAANRMDVDAFFSYVLDTDKGMIIQNGTLFKTRAEAVQAVRDGFMGVEKVNRQFINPQVTVISADAALLASEGTVSATLADGRTMEGRFAVSLVFVRRDGEWKLLHGHYSTPVRR